MSIMEHHIPIKPFLTTSKYPIDEPLQPRPVQNTGEQGSVLVSPYDEHDHIE